MAKHFISEAIEPEHGAFDTTPMSRGEPAVPRLFFWRGEQLVVSAVDRTWRSTKHDRGDDYLAKHWFEIKTTDGRLATIYFERHPRKHEARWWLYTIED